MSRAELIPIRQAGESRSARTAPESHARQIPPFARYVLGRGWLHLVLLSGVGIFTFPFIWMIATSMKTDEELVSPGWLPSVPHFVADSPYVLPQPDPIKPEQVDQDAWDRVEPKLVGATMESLKSATQMDSDVDPAVHHAAAAQIVVNKLVARLPTKLWSGSDQSVVDAYKALMTPEVLTDALSASLARYELRGVVLRTIDMHMTNICEGADVAKLFRVESGPGQIVQDAGGLVYLKYHFNSSSDGPIVLRCDFDSPADAEQLHKLIVSHVTDNSWHRVTSTLDIGGSHWTSDQITPLGQHRPASMLLQPPGFEDESFKPRKWIPMKLESQTTVAPDQSRKAVLRLIITPSSTLRAIYEKVTFNYRRAMRQIPFWTYVRNSLLLVGLTTLGVLFSSTFVAYAFARLRWPGRSVALLLLLSTMMLPSHVTAIPSFLIWKSIGWYNTLNPMWFPAWLGSAFFIFLMVQHMKTIPRELEEAARIDGLNAVQTWYYIILPLVKPVAAAIAIMTVMGAWNEFMAPLIYLRDQDKFPLSLGLFGLRADMGTTIDWTMVMAGNVLMTMPVIVMFIVFQKYFVQGVTMSGMKG